MAPQYNSCRVCSAAEYGAPIWLNSAHTQKVDVQLNETMRIFSWTLRSTPTKWLPVLSHIIPPGLRHKAALLREYKRAQDNPQLPIHQDANKSCRGRLRSRKPTTGTAKELLADHFDPLDSWERRWMDNRPPQSRNLPCIRMKPPAFEQPRKTWTALNRIRTNHGICADSLYKWGRTQSAGCDCGAEKQTVRHMVMECPDMAYGGSFSDFLMATDSAIDYIVNLNVCLWQYEIVLCVFYSLILLHLYVLCYVFLCIISASSYIFFFYNYVQPYDKYKNT